MRLRISHSTTYRYEPPANGVVQILRLTPRNHDSQYIADWQVDISTDAALRVRHDAFGNITHSFFNDGPLSELTIHVEGRIETHDTGGVIRGTIERFPASLFLRTTPLTSPNAEMHARALDLWRLADGHALNFLHRLMANLHTHMTFDTDPTHSQTSAVEAFNLGRGVCQDYAHVFIACARAAGIPARYVAGHFLRVDGIVHQDAGHAWVEAFVPELGWIGFDAANGICITDAHARVAIGLDSLGAAPVRGTRFGGGSEHLEVRVKVDQAGHQSQS